MLAHTIRNNALATLSILLAASLVSACSTSPQPKAETATARGTEAGTTEKTSISEPAESSDQPEETHLPPASEFGSRNAYIATIGAGTITALDLDSNEIAWTLAVSEGSDNRKPESAMGIAASRDGTRVFTGDVANNEVVVVDTDKREVTKRIPVDHKIHAIDICPHGHWLWVSGQTEDYPWLSASTIINVKTLEKKATVSPGLGNAAHLTFTPDGEEVWIASVSTNLVWIANTMSGEVIDTIAVGPDRLEGQSPEAKMGLIGLNELAISPDGERAFAVGPELGSVFVLDVAERRLIDQVEVGERTHGIGVTRDGKQVWTANNAGSVTVIDAETLEVIDQIDLGEQAGEMPFAHVGFSVDGRRAYVSMAKTLTVIDVADRRVITTVESDVSPHEISLEDYYVASSGDVTSGTDSMDAADTDEGPDSESSSSKSSKAAGIEVSATPERTDQGLEIQLVIDTHSGDLMEFDVVEQTTVVIAGDPVAAEKLTWQPESESSHHRSGTLVVDAEVPSGAKLRLTIDELGVPERTLEWDDVR